MTDSQAKSGVHEATILDYARIILRHWRLVLLVCVPIVAATVAWSLVATETFQATTSIVPPLDSAQGGSSLLARGLMSGMEGTLLRSALDMRNVTDTYVGILESRAVADRIVDRFDLMRVYSLPGCRWRTLEHLRANTDIKVTKEGIVRISVVDEDRERVAAMANAYVEELDLQNKRLSGGQATSKRVFLENHLKEIEQKFRHIETLPTKQAQVQEALYELLSRECELAKIEEAKSMPTIQVLDKAVPPEHKHKPNRRQMVTKAVVGSFAIAVLLAFICEYIAQARRNQNGITASAQAKAAQAGGAPAIREYGSGDIMPAAGVESRRS